VCTCSAEASHPVTSCSLLPEAAAVCGCISPPAMHGPPVGLWVTSLDVPGDTQVLWQVSTFCLEAVIMLSRLCGYAGFLLCINQLIDSA
jgi:hypothetical protein